MSLRPLIPMLVALLLASAAVMTSAVAQGNGLMAGLAAGLFAVAVITAALRVNAPLWRRAETHAEPEVEAGVEATVVRRNARLAAVLYAWGAVTLFGIYTLTGLYWRHGWQYATVMALIAAALLTYAHLVEVAGSSLRTPGGLKGALAFTLVHGTAAAAALLWLVASGKVWSARGDWAANHVFVAGALTMAALCAIAAWTQWRLQQRP